MSNSKLKHAVLVNDLANAAEGYGIILIVSYNRSFLVIYLLLVQIYHLVARASKREKVILPRIKAMAVRNNQMIPWSIFSV